MFVQPILYTAPTSNKVTLQVELMNGHSHASIHDTQNDALIAYRGLSKDIKDHMYSGYVLAQEGLVLASF